MRDISKLIPLTDPYGLIGPVRDPATKKRLYRARQAGWLHQLLPGVFCLSERRDDFTTRVNAVAHWNPRATITGLAAARLTFWPSAPVSEIDLLGQTRGPAAGGYRWHTHTVNIDAIGYLGPLRVTTPAWTAVWLSGWDEGEAIEIALRQGVPISQVNDAMVLLRWQRGNPQRRDIVRRSQHAPWSKLERVAHRIFDQAGIDGWVGNWWYQPSPGQSGWPIDLAFVELKVAIELDGYEFHSDRKSWHKDRMKDNHLTLNGWIVLRFTWADLDDPEAMVSTVRAALLLASRRSATT